MGGGVLPCGDILTLLLGYPGHQLLGHLSALPGLPGDVVLPLLIPIALVQQFLALPLEVCLLRGPIVENAQYIMLIVWIIVGHAQYIILIVWIWVELVEQLLDAVHWSIHLLVET